MQEKRYKIARVINNNVITSLEGDSEVVLMGKGISFNKHITDFVDNSKIEKIFVMKGKDIYRFNELAENIPMDYFELAAEIVNLYEKSLSAKLNNAVHITLADHLFNCIDREKNGIIIRNELNNELKRFYPNEFEVGLQALRIIKAKTGVLLSKDEAGFITLHFINASEKGISINAQKRIELIEKVIEVIETYFDKKLDNDSLVYERFITHLKYFSVRVFTKEKKDSFIRDDFFYRIGKIQYPNIKKCIDLIEVCIYDSFKIKITDEEKGYLMIHILNLIKYK